MTNIAITKAIPFIRDHVGLKEMYTYEETHRVMCEYAAEMFMKTKEGICLEIAANISEYVISGNSEYGVYVVEEAFEKLINNKI